MKTTNRFFKCLIIAVMFLSIKGVYAANLITNGNFEEWGTLTDDETSGLKKGTPTGWTIQAGNGSLATYQSTVTPSGTGTSAFLCNVSTSSSRFISPNTAVLAAGTYKLSYKLKGRGVMGNVTMVESTQSSIRGSWEATASAVNIFSSVGQTKDTMLAGSDWTLKEYLFVITTDDKAYKLVFWPNRTPGALSENVADYYLMDDVVLEEYTAPSAICTIKELRIYNRNYNLLVPNVLSYSVELPYNASVPPVTAQATDTDASVVITPATNLSGTEAERTTTILVTAADNISTKEYKVIFSLTDKRIMEGFASTDLPGTPYTFSNGTNDWTVDANAGYNGAALWGANSLRSKNAGTNVYFTLNELENVGDLSFFIKKRGTGLDATLTILYQPISTPDVWNTASTITSFSAEGEIKTVNIQQSGKINIKFDLQKAEGNSPFNIDDIIIIISEKSPSTGLMATNSCMKIISINGGVSLYTEKNAQYSICSITGQLMESGPVYGHKTIELPNAACYIVTLYSESGTVTRKIIK